jgi:hypothetical protein
MNEPENNNEESIENASPYLNKPNHAKLARLLKEYNDKP